MTRSKLTQAIEVLRSASHLLLLLATLAFVLAGCGEGRDAWERIYESGVLRVGIDPTFPPFAEDAGGALNGIDVELARALATEMGLEAQFIYFGYDGLYDALTTGQVDALISALVIAPERTKEIAYSDAYFDAGLVLIAPAAGEDLSGKEALRGRALAVELGALGHVTALEWQRELGDLAVETFATVEEAIDAVGHGAADTALVDGVGGRLYLRERPPDAPPMRVTAVPTAAEPYAIAVRIEDRMLLEELNAALERLANSGELADIIDGYLGPTQ